MPDSSTSRGLLGSTARIVSAYASNHTVAAEDVATLIRTVHTALSGLGDSRTMAAPPARAVAVAAERPKAAVPVSKSVFPDYIVCLEDGKKLKMLKRHLQTSYGLTPDQYRLRWDLDSDYPMVAPNYAAKRSSLAKAIGLGTKPRDRRAG